MYCNDNMIKTHATQMEEDFDCNHLYIYQHINTINILAPVINKNCLILMIQHRNPKIWKLVIVKCAHLKIV